MGWGHPVRATVSWNECVARGSWAVEQSTRRNDVHVSRRSPSRAARFSTLCRSTAAATMPQWEGHRRPCEGTWAHCAHALFFAKEALGASPRRSASEASVIYPPAMPKQHGTPVDRSSASLNECFRPACAAVSLGGVVPNHTPRSSISRCLGCSGDVRSRARLR